MSTRLLSVARQYAERPDDWPFAPRFDPVERWYHRLALTDDAEVWLLTWLPGQGTDLHDHGDSAGAFAVVSGFLTERIANIHNGQVRLPETRLPSGTGRHFGVHHIHQLVNDSERPAVSVHAYGPALTRMTRYHIEHGGLHVATVDRAGVQW